MALNGQIGKKNIYTYICIDMYGFHLFVFFSIAYILISVVSCVCVEPVWVQEMFK